jgi:hypothetical protein
VDIRNPNAARRPRSSLRTSQAPRTAGIVYLVFAAQPTGHGKDCRKDHVRLSQMTYTDCAKINRLDVRPKRVFANRAGAPVVYEASEQLLDKGVKGRGKELDRVFGLVLNQHIAARRDIRHNPFADGKILYPFLTIEAKSGRGSPGFESVETQAAFPIMTFLQLQQNLSASTQMKIDPLVWFFANQGDVWSVYACVVDRAQSVSYKFETFISGKY